jgi:uncharacterized LabA/DUF88 family protein
MSNDRAYVFYDGNNFYHNLKKTLRDPHVNPLLFSVKPKDIDLYKLSEEICNHFKVKHIKSLYYNSIPSIFDNPKVYTSHKDYLTWVESLPKFEVRTRTLQRKSTAELLEERMNILKGLKLCSSCQPIAENNCNSCIGPMDRKEKGIDVMIAISMVFHTFKKNCDYCILVSGDSDFVPALDLVKLLGGNVFSASFYTGYSTELRGKFKPFLVIGDDLLIKCIKNNP